MTSPLGRYSNIGALFASLFVLTVNVVVHGSAALAGTATDAFLDNISILAFGILMGQIGAHNEAVQIAANTINGVEAQTKAANARLDQIGAPAAKLTDDDPPII